MKLDMKLLQALIFGISSPEWSDTVIDKNKSNKAIRERTMIAVKSIHIGL